MIPKMTVVTVLLAIIGGIGAGGFYMGIQAANSTSMKETIAQLLTNRDKTAQDITDIKADIALIKSKGDYNTSRATHP